MSKATAIGADLKDFIFTNSVVQRTNPVITLTISVILRVFQNIGLSSF